MNTSGWVCNGNLPLKNVGMQYIRFAIEEPKLFQLLFMSEQKAHPRLSNVLSLIDQNYQSIYLSIQKGYDVNQQTAERLYRHLWIYTRNRFSLCNKGVRIQRVRDERYADRSFCQPFTARKTGGES